VQRGLLERRGVVCPVKQANLNRKAVKLIASTAQLATINRKAVKRIVSPVKQVNTKL